jgi:hypothetical protein
MLPRLRNALPHKSYYAGLSFGMGDPAEGEADIST